MLTDLHIHSVFSDGQLELDDLTAIYSKGDIIALTDHNSTDAWEQASALCQRAGIRWIAGLELQLRGQPDYLVYFPLFDSDRGAVEEFRKSVKALARADHQLSRAVYQKCFGFADFEANFDRAKNTSNTRVDFCTTKLLAEMITTRQPDVDVATVRQSKGAYLDALKVGSTAAREWWQELLIASEDEKWAFSLSERFGGQIVLAHPLREMMRKVRNDFQCTEPAEALDNIFASFFRRGGQCIELCLHNEQFLRDTSGFSKDLVEYSQKLVALADAHRFEVVTGSDLHGNKAFARAMRDEMTRLTDAGHPRFPRWLT
jgi:hypothetical protein